MYSCEPPGVLHTKDPPPNAPSDINDYIFTSEARLMGCLPWALNNLWRLTLVRFLIFFAASGGGRGVAWGMNLAVEGWRALWH